MIVLFQIASMGRQQPYLFMDNPKVLNVVLLVHSSLDYMTGGIVNMQVLTVCYVSGGQCSPDKLERGPYVYARCVQIWACT